MDDDDYTKVQKPKRKYLKQEFSELADIAVEITSYLTNVVNSIGSEGLKDNAQRVHDTETKGDVVRDRVLKSFALEKHPPPLQLDRMEMLNSLEKVINKTEHAVTQIELAGKFFPDNLIHDLQTIMKDVAKTVSDVSNGIKIIFESFAEAIKTVENVENMRDRIRIQVFELQYKALDNTNLNHQNLFAVDKISTQISSIAEKAKEVADVLEKMKLKYL